MRIELDRIAKLYGISVSIGADSSIEIILSNAMCR